MAKLSKISSPSEFVTLRIKKSTMDILKRTKLCYELAWSDENVTYDTILVRLLESGVKRLDPEVNRLRDNVQSSIKEFKVTSAKAAQKEVDEQVDRADDNGASLKEESMKEQQVINEEKPTEESPKSEIKPEEEDVSGITVKEEKQAYSEVNVLSDEEELDAWFKDHPEQYEIDDDFDYEKLFRRFVLRDEDQKYRSIGISGSEMAVGDDNKMQQLYDFDEEANTPEEKEKATRLLATYRRRLDAELEGKLQKEQEEEERRQAEERKREEDRIASLKAPYMMSDTDRKAYDLYKDEENQVELIKRVAAALKELPDKEQMIIDGKGLWASNGELIFPVLKDGRFKKVRNWDGTVKQPETFYYKLMLK